MYKNKKLARGLLLTAMTGAVLTAPIITSSQLFETKVASAHSAEELTIEKGEKMVEKKEKVSVKDKKEVKVESLFDNKITKKFKAETTQVGEHTISYEIYKGKGKVDKTYILAHGASANGEIMKVLATEIIEKDSKSRVIIVDLPLHGKSTAPSYNAEELNVHYYVDVMYDFLEAKTKDKTIQGKVNWAGWSMGGSIGLLLDLKGAKIDELTLLNSAPVWHEIAPMLPMLDPALMGFIFPSTIEADLTINISDEDKAEIMGHMGALATTAPDVMAQDLKGIVPDIYDVTSDLDKIKAKTLIISSTKDTVSNVGVQQLMDEEIKKSKLIIYEDETHAQLVKPIQAEKIAKEMVKYFK